MIDVDALLGEHGPVADAIPGYQPRISQRLMAQAVAEALFGGQQLVVEAGTGTGKTFAYLLPALLSGARTIVSTGTRALQDQLYHRDLPMIAKAVGRPVRTALLKGRSNYLCLQRLDAALTENGAFTGKEASALRSWRDATKTGDKAEVTAIAEDATLWPRVTSTAENCHGQKCAFYDDCYVAKARREAQQADLVIVNHHLLLADLAFREGGFVEFLPEADAIIIDEAHQLPDIALTFFGVSLSMRQFADLYDELEVLVSAVGGPPFNDALRDARTAMLKVREHAPSQPGRYDQNTVDVALSEQIGQLASALQALVDTIDALGNTVEGIEPLLDRLLRLYDRLRIVSAEDDEEGLRWLDVTQRGLRWHMTPLDVSERMRQAVDATEAAWVFTSATLAVGENFMHFTDRLGLNDARCLKFDTPFDLVSRARLLVPRDLPAPNMQQYIPALLERTTPLLEHVDGGAFFLHTSYRALHQSADWFRERPELLRGRTLYVQGDAPRGQLLASFRKEGNAVLLATGTFWEGVDVRGRALRLVVIDKLPFASPDDPMLVARSAFLRSQQRNPFVEQQLPEAVLALKQGVGRLLRDVDDFGVIAIGDPRLHSKGYGKIFLSALAPIPVHESVTDVVTFLDGFAAEQQQQAAL
ncbi:MAG: ATP-dependent DNA helicase [Pseudomonadota bacterium]